MNIPSHKIDQLVAMVRHRFPNWSKFADPAFDADEVTYKQATIKRAQEMLSAKELQRLIDKRDFDEVIDRLDKLGKDNNLLFRSIPLQGDLQILYQKKLNRPKFCRAFQDLIYGKDDLETRFGAWVSFVDKEQLPNYWTFPTYFLFIFHPDSEIFVKPRTTKWLLKFLDQDAAIGRPANWASYSMIREIAAALRVGLKDHGPRDMADIQSLIWVCASESGQPHAVLAAPFNQYFDSLEEADWAFDFLKETLDRLGVKGPDDTRVALTLPKSENLFRLNFCQWVVATFFSEDETPERAEISLLSGLVNLKKKGQFTTKKGEPEAGVYAISIEKLRAMEPQLRSALDKSLAFIATHFKDQPVTGYLNSHEPILMEMVFDKEKRAQHLTEGFIPQTDPHYWKIAPGDDAWQWDECREEGFIAMGWSDFGDLSSLDRAAFDKRFDKLQAKHTDWTRNALNQLWNFSQIRKGDRIVANRGTTEVLGIGTVTGPYKFDPNAEHYSHILPVKWDDVRPRQISKLGWRRTLVELDEEDFDEILNSLPPVALAGPKPQPFSLEDALEGVFMGKDQLALMLARLRRKKALILQGPPGVGKTFVAHRIAYALMGQTDKQRVAMIQFHPSYSYEDFIQGYRPTTNGSLERRNGVFYEFARQARNNPSQDWVFIIDEINRGNLAKIFGELLMLLEADKRGPGMQVSLTYSQNGETFYLPENLYVIGTMNTADRSLAMVDYALRRRFAFQTLAPAIDSSEFADWLLQKGVSSTLLQKIVTRIGKLNEIIDKERDLGDRFRIGHSFFCPGDKDTPDDAWYRNIITGEIAPLLEEYFDVSSRVKQMVEDMLA